MTDRIAKIILRGDIAGLKASMTAASKSVNDVAGRMTAASKEGERFRQNLSAVGDTAGKFGLVAAAGVGLAVRAFANFDEAMSAVAASGQDARSSIDDLRKAAIDAGARTKFSATEAAEAIENLAKAGVSAADILGGGLDGALDLAAAGGLGVAEAAEIAATAMNQFSKTGADVPHIADLLAAAAGKAMGEVADMGAAFKFVGPVASQLGVSMEQTAGSIALLAQNGVLGEQAGTSLRGMLTSLTSPSAIASDTMKKLGISMYDAKGEFIGLDGLAGQLKSQLGGLGEAERNAALGRIFGNEQITAARILYAGGAEDVRKWTAAVDDQGFAAETAAIKMDNLKGDLEQLGGALETALIGTGEGANGPLREMVQLLSTLVDGYNSLPGPIKTLILAGGGLTAAVGGTAFAASRAISAYSGLKENLSEVGASFDKTKAKAVGMRLGAATAGAGLAALSGPAHEADEALGDLVDTASAAAFGFAVGGPIGAALAAGVSILSSFGNQTAAAAQAQEKFQTAGKRVADTLDAQTGALTDLTRATAGKELADAGVLQSAKAMGISLEDTLNAALGGEDALKRVTAASESWADSLARSGDYTEDQEGTLQLFREGVGATSDAIADQRTEMGLVKEATGGMSSEISAAGGAAEAATDQIEGLSDALDGLLDPLLSQDQAMVEWKRSIQSLTKDLLENGGGLDSNTKAGQDNRDMIRDRVSALKDSAQADLEATGNQEKFASKLERGAKQILEAGTAAGISKKEMRGYLETLGLTPSQIKTLIKAQDDATPKIKGVGDDLANLDGKSANPKVGVDTSGARNEINTLQRLINGMNGKTVRVAVEGGTGGGITRNATGGAIRGKGTGTSDSILSWVSNGEHVLTAEEVEKAGGQDEVYRLRAAIRSGNMPAFASGGAVGRASALEIKSQQRTVRDLERSLREREEYGKKRKGKKRPTRLVLKPGSLDRQIAQLELSEARRELRDLKSGAAAKREKKDEAREAKESAAEQVRQDVGSAKADFSSNFSISGLSSTGSVSRRLDSMIADATLFTTLLSDLKKKGASPWLLAQLVNEGPTKAAIRLAKQYSTDSAALAAINGKASQIDALSSQYGGMVGNPKFSSAAAWNPGISNSSSKTVNINAMDPSAYINEIRRVVRHELSMTAAGAGV